MSIKGRFKRAIMYICIIFFLLAVAFVYITFRGKSQAGLIEVGCSAFLFVIFLHILKIVIPQSLSKIVTVLSLLLAVILIYGNYSLQKNRNKEYTFKEILVGDLLVKKLIGKPKEIPEEQLTKKIKDIIPGEFTQTRTEKYTIESPFEKPEKDLIGKPVALSLDEHDSISLSKERAYSFGIPKEVTSYKLKAANKEELKVERARYVIENFEFRLDKFNEQIMERHIQSPLSLPLELSLGPDHLLRSVYSKTDISADILDLDMQQGLQEEHFRDEPGKQAEGELQIP
jgi:hypothetical protein